MSTAILLSGGVDSSVALSLLQDRGYSNIEAFYIKIWLEDDAAHLGNCPWEDDLRFAREVCKKAKVPLQIVPLQSDYREIIVEFTINELRSGRTPSPDIQCNELIKFGSFYDQIGGKYDVVATGHYAQIETHGTLRKLKRALDPVKDQTYFLSRLNQTQLSQAIFPLGNLHKYQVRQYANQYNIPTKYRKDSQGICFLGGINFSKFVRYHLGCKQGDIIDIHTGKKLGIHNGYWFFTIGQRQGLALHGGPWYVVKKDIDLNVIFVSHRDRCSENYVSNFEVDNIHWIAESPYKQCLHLKIRHGPMMNGCTISNIGNGRLRVRMDVPDSGIALGQSAVFYDGDICLGSGMICKYENC